MLNRTADVQRRQADDGRMDGFVAAYRRIGRDGTTSMGYYDDRDLPYYWNLADEYTLFDRYFSAARAGTRLNAFYWVAGAPTPNGSEVVPPGGYGDIPTIFDRLEERGVDWKFYVENYDPRRTFRTPDPATARIPLVGFARFVDDPRLAAHIVDLSDYYRDLEDGTLPAVSYVVSAGSSESPPGRVASGQTLVRSMVTGLETSQYWPRSAFLLAYSGWGGFYDHVPPPTADGTAAGVAGLNSLLRTDSACRCSSSARGSRTARSRTAGTRAMCSTPTPRSPASSSGLQPADPRRGRRPVHIHRRAEAREPAGLLRLLGLTAEGQGHPAGARLSQADTRATDAGCHRTRRLTSVQSASCRR